MGKVFDSLEFCYKAIVSRFSLHERKNVRVGFDMFCTEGSDFLSELLEHLIVLQNWPGSWNLQYIDALVFEYLEKLSI